MSALWGIKKKLLSHWISDGPTSLSNYLDSKQRGVTGAKRGAIKWAINRDVTLGEGTLHCTWTKHECAI